MDYIKEILSNKNKNKSEKWISENFPVFHSFINSLFSEITWKEKLYLHINSLTIPPVCYCGGKLKFKSIQKGYTTFCSTKCLSNDTTIKNKRMQSCIKKYGVDNPMKDTYIKEKYNESIMEKYGVDNISTLSDTKNKVRESNLKKYGFEYISQSPDARINLSKSMTNKSEVLNNIQNDKLKLYLSEKVKKYNIQFISIVDSSIYKLRCQENHEFSIHKNMLNDRISNSNTICTVCNKISNESDSQNQLYNFIKSIYSNIIIPNDRSAIGMEIDIYLPDIKLGIEFNGIFWHSDKYKSKKYHLNKTNMAEDKGIKLIHIWEDDWKFKREIVESRISNIIGISGRIWARLCEVREISYKESISFLNENHIQGNCISKYRIALFYKNEIVSIMTFGNLRKSLGQKSKDGSYELLRFCNRLNTTIVGGASKLFSFFIRKYSPINIVSYADRCWSNGNLYKRLGFSMDKFTEPNYYYVINGIRKNRFNYTKSKLVKNGFDPQKSESQIMKEIGYNRIYDSGNIKFVYTKK